MLTTDKLRSLLGAGLGLEANVAGYIDARCRLVGYCPPMACR
jgi:hypothetical protein